MGCSRVGYAGLNFFYGKKWVGSAVGRVLDLSGSRMLGRCWVGVGGGGGGGGSERLIGRWGGAVGRGGRRIECRILRGAR